MADEDFLRRWARRKTEARQGGEPASQPLPPIPPAAGAGAAPVVVAAPAIPGAAPAPLPDPAHLEPGADISAFMAKGVDELLRRKALRALFSDPRFNVMDRMDVYIDDYSIADPLPPDWLDKLEQVTHLGDRAGRDHEQAERQAALDAHAGSDGSAAGASEPREARAEEPAVKDVEPSECDGEPGPEAAIGQPSPGTTPEPQP